MHTSTFHKSHSIRKFTRKMPRPRAPWSSTSLYSYRKKPSVWTRCLGNQTSAEHNVDTYTRAASVYACSLTPLKELCAYLRAIRWVGSHAELRVATWHSFSKTLEAEMHRCIECCGCAKLYKTGPDENNTTTENGWNTTRQKNVLRHLRKSRFTGKVPEPRT